MNLNNVLIRENILPEHLCISAINYQGYLYLYDKTLKGFDAKKSLKAVSTSLEWNVFGIKVSRCLKKNVS